MSKFLAGVILLSFACLQLQCKKQVKENKDRQQVAGICLSFDDQYIDNWVSHLDILDEYQVKATFYISNFEKLNADQLDKLRLIKSKGHEIAYHTSNHKDLVKLRKQITMAQLVEREIRKGKQLMRNKGFEVKTFAYPYGANSTELNSEMLKHFRLLRCLNGTPDVSKSFVKPEGNSIIYAIGLDNSSHNSIEKIKRLMDKAQKTNNCLNLVGHYINNPDVAISTPIEKLRAVLDYARQLNLKYYRAMDIAR